MKLISLALVVAAWAAHGIRRPGDGLILNGVAYEPIAVPLEPEPYVWTGRWQYEAYGADGELIWPADPDEVPPWRLEREAYAKAYNSVVPGYRCRRDAEHHLDLMAMSCAQIAIAPPKIAPALSANLAARRFVDELRHPTDVREFSAQEVADIYAGYCEDRHVTPTHIDQVKKAMLGLPGVYRDQIIIHEGGKRKRPMRWIIVPAAELANEPNDYAEPIRLAA